MDEQHLGARSLTNIPVQQRTSQGAEDLLNGDCQEPGLPKGRDLWFCSNPLLLKAPRDHTGELKRRDSPVPATDGILLNQHFPSKGHQSENLSPDVILHLLFVYFRIGFS